MSEKENEEKKQETTNSFEDNTSPEPVRHKTDLKHVRAFTIKEPKSGVHKPTAEKQDKSKE